MTTSNGFSSVPAPELDIEDLLDKMDKAYQKHQAGAMKMSEIDAEIKRMMRD